MKRPYFSSPDHLALCLNKCLKGKASRPGKQVHAMLLSSGTDTNVLSLSSKLVAMYASSGDMRSAKSLLVRIQKPNAFAFNWMIFASSFNGDFKEAIGYFHSMRKMGISPNKFTLSILLRACLGLSDLNKGKEVHCVVTKMGFVSDVSVGNMMIDLYCKCGCVRYARKVFDKMPQRDIACWTSLICGYFTLGKTKIASKMFDKMKSQGTDPNEFTWNAMIFGYARCGDSIRALALLERMRREGNKPDSVTWTAIISGLAQSQNAPKALEMFSQMILSGTRPNQVTISALLPICGQTGSIHLGRQIHSLIYRMGIEINPFVGSALVDMYSKCGDPKNAYNVFDSVRTKSVALWNSMINCYGKNGLSDSSIELFEAMTNKSGPRPNKVTMICVLSACSHGGLVEKGLTIFGSMKEVYGVEPSTEHYSCVVDLLCRSGKVEEAYDVLKRIPDSEVVTESIVGAFFHGCKVHERMDLAVKFMSDEDISGLGFKRPQGFVMLSNIHACHGDWEEVENLRKVMAERNVHKSPAFSCVKNKD